VNLRRQRQAEAAEVVDEHVEAIRRMLSVWDPMPGSQLEADHNLAQVLQRRDGSPWGDEPVDTFCSLVALTATAMVDHLASLAHLLTADVDLGTMVMGRSVLEAGGRVCWMLEPADLRSKVGRGYAVRVRGLQQMSKYVTTALTMEPDDPQVIQRAVQDDGQVQRTIQAARSLGLPVHKPSRKGDGPKLWQLQTALPDGGVLVHAALKEVNAEIPLGIAELLFGSWSGVSHSAYEALREAIEPASAVSHGTAKLVRFGTDPHRRSQGAMYSLVASVAAALAAARYVGQDTSEISEVVERRTEQVTAMLVRS